jgi:radical SAM protein with 4Fe4S-binding SPASM domain
VNPVSAKRFDKVYIEIGNVCNLHCGFCPEISREKALMDESLFTRVIAQVAPLTAQVCFHLMGEPLAHPKFARYVEIGAEFGARLNITTNGSLLDLRSAAALLNRAVAQVNFSVHSFRANFPRAEIGEYLSRVFAFTREAFVVRPDLYVNYRLWNLAGPEQSSNEEILRAVESEFGVTLARDVDPRWKKGRHVAGRLFVHYDTRFDWPNSSAPIRSETGTCRALSHQIGVLSDGTVVPCCLDKDGAVALGDLHRQSIEEILAGERASRMRQGFRQGRLVEDLCRRCSFISRFDRSLRGTTENVVKYTTTDLG